MAGTGPSGQSGASDIVTAATAVKLNFHRTDPEY